MKQAPEAIRERALKLAMRVFKDRSESLLDALDPEIRSVLLSMYHEEPQHGSDGQLHPIDNTTRIIPSQGMWLYNLCLSVKPRRTLEIGLAYGYSTLYFLAAILKNKTGIHTAIDPYQREHWHGIGLTHALSFASRGGKESIFRFIEDRSDRAAADLLRSNDKFDLIFIDGGHRFDDALVDFYLYAQLCELGGRIVFDDMCLQSIQTVADFIRTNRKDFIELPTNEANICVFQKVGTDKRKWSDFHAFKVSCQKTGDSPAKI